VTISGTAEQSESAERRVPEGRAADDVGERDRTEVTAVGRVIATIADDDETVGLDFGNALQQKARALARVTDENDVAGSRRPARRDHQKPVPLPQRRLHAVAAHGHPPGAHRYFLLA